MHLPPLIYDLAVILAVAGVISAVFLKIKQPVVLGYILAGLIVGPFTPPFQLVTDLPSIRTLAELGVIFVMFTLGLEFSFRKLMSVGSTALITVLLEALFFTSVGYNLGLLLGWSEIESLFLGGMIAISSTTVIIKTLEELNLKTHKFASLIFGILIVEDLLAILLLVALSTVATTQNFSALALAGTAINLLAVTSSWFIIGHFIIPKLMNFFARSGSNEMITLVSIGLCLSLVVVGSHMGYSSALGAFIMGSILAETKIIHQIENLMAPLKNLFGAIFFVSVGMLIDPNIIWQYKATILVLCVVVICGKIFITTLGCMIAGQTIRNSLQVGFTLAQIGEFSFIMAGLGVTLKAIDPDIQPIAVAVSIVTTFTTPYLVRISYPLAIRIEGLLPQDLKQKLALYEEWWKFTGTRFYVAPNIATDKNKEKQNLKNLVPWDGHVYSFTVHPNAPLVNMNLIEANLRRTYGVNIVAIRRGLETIIAPNALVRILPGDTIVALGTDEQLDQLRLQLELPRELNDDTISDSENYVLKNFHLVKESWLTGKTIQNSEIRDKYHSLVVGIEREGKRVVNPSKEFLFSEGDIVWIVGESSFLQKLKDTDHFL